MEKNVESKERARYVIILMMTIKRTCSRNSFIAGFRARRRSLFDMRETVTDSLCNNLYRT